MSDNQWNASDYALNSSAQFKWATELDSKLSFSENEKVLMNRPQLFFTLPSAYIFPTRASETLITWSPTFSYELKMSR